MIGLYAIGDRVTWVLVARGVVRRQDGVVAQIVPPGERPVGLRRGLVRDHESYAVSANGTLYWPIVEALAPAPALIRETPTDATLRLYAEAADTFEVPR